MPLRGGEEARVVVEAGDEVGETFFEPHRFCEVVGQFREEAAGLHHDQVAAAIAVDLRDNEIDLLPHTRRRRPCSARRPFLNAWPWIALFAGSWVSTLSGRAGPD